MNIPAADLRKQYHSIKPEIDAAIAKVLDTTSFILGEAVEKFEQAFAAAHETKHCIAVGSGTDALHLALWAAGVGPGDEVITTPFTFIATAEAISLLGAVPVFADINPETFLLDPAGLEKLLTPKTKAVMPVHLYGQAAHLVEIKDFCSQHNLVFIEDAAQAHLARHKGKYVGNFGLGACFSFYPGKNLGAFGEGGAVTTNDDAFAAECRLIRNHGQARKYTHTKIGTNYRMDGIQGAVLGAKLPHLKAWTATRREMAETYRERLSGIGDLVLPFVDPESEHVYHLFTVTSARRDELQTFLAAKGISAGLHYSMPLHLQEAYKSLGYGPGSLPVAEHAAKTVISIPLYPEMTAEMLNYVSAAIIEFYR